jgi:hypothetical protein
LLRDSFAAGLSFEPCSLSQTLAACRAFWRRLFGLPQVCFPEKATGALPDLSPISHVNLAASGEGGQNFFAAR